MTRIVGFLAVALFLTSNTYAQLVAWEVTGVNAQANNPLSGIILDSNIISASIILGSGVSASSAGDTFGGSNFDKASFTDAISDGDYISIFITPSSPYEVSFSSFTYLGGLSGAANFNVALLSSVTGFSSSDTLDIYPFSTASPQARSITLSSIPALQNVIGTVEFRLYGWRDSTGTSTFRIRSNAGYDLTISGSTTLTAVPEPSTYAAILGGVALVGVVAIRRRKRVTIA